MEEQKKEINKKVEKTETKNTKNVNNSSATNNSKKQDTEKVKLGFGKTIALPFVSGLVGAAIVVGVTIPFLPQILGTNIANSNTNSNAIVAIQKTSTNSQSSTNTTKATSNSASVAATVMPSIAKITVTYPVSSVFGGTTSTEAGGSGVVITEDGYVVTNYHVINSESDSFYYSLGEATSVKVQIYGDETKYDAKIIGSDELTDIAVLKIEKDGLTPATLGDSDKIQIGEFAMTLGCPVGMDYSVAAGIISGVNRKVQADGRTLTLIQTDASINSGNSGGALANSNGEVIGICNMKIASTDVDNVAFAIPVNTMVDVANQLIEKGKVIRPFIGIAGTALDSKTAEKYNLIEGVYIKKVYDFSPAEKAGIQIGDVVVSIDDKAVKSMDEITDYKLTKKVGDTITIKVFRDGIYKDLKLTLAEEQN